MLSCLLALWLPGASIAAEAAIHGIGATFPAPVYSAWAREYRQATGVAVAYEATGSGAGIDAMRHGSADFGGTEVPLSQDDLQAAGLVQFAVLTGGIVPVVNLRGIKSGALKLSGRVLGDIYLGRISRWDDPAIAALNPTIALPRQNITVVFRTEASGSSYLWSQYLAAANADWRTSIGASATPAWRAGVGGAGNEGVAAFVKRTRAALGYVEFAYAQAHHLSYVSVDDARGAFSVPSLGAFESRAWPITAPSYVLLQSRPQSAAHTRAVLTFFHWALVSGASTARQRDYVPLSPGAAADTERMWAAGIRSTDGASVWTP